MVGHDIGKEKWEWVMLNCMVMECNMIGSRLCAFEQRLFCKWRKKVLMGFVLDIVQKPI